MTHHNIIQKLEKVLGVSNEDKEMLNRFKR